RRLHGTVAQAVATRLRAAGATVAQPAGAFYLYPDFEPLRRPLETAHAIRTADDLAGHLLERHGVGTLSGASFGEPARALRMRVATSLLYGDTDDQRTTALHAETPPKLPWIATALYRLTEALTHL